MKAWSDSTFPVRSINKMREKEKKEKKKEQNHTIRRSLLKGKRNSKLITDMEYYLTERLIQLFQVTEMKRG